MRALVTGASGFIGGHVVRALAVGGMQVRAFSCGAPALSHVRGDVDFMRGDVRDAHALRRAIDGCDAVFHLAAVYSYARSDVTIMRDVNVEGTRRVLEAALRGTKRRIVHTSSCATCGPVRGRPASESDVPSNADLAIPYKWTKFESELLALRAARDGADVVVVNPTVPVGPGDVRPTPTGKMVADVAYGRARAYLAGSALNVVAVEDVAAGHVSAFQHGRPGQRYLLGGDNLALREVFSAIARAVGRKPPGIGVPWSAAYAAARLVDAVMRGVGREPALLMLDEVRAGRVPHLFDDAKARAELGYVSRPATQALAAAARDAVG